MFRCGCAAEVGYGNQDSRSWRTRSPPEAAEDDGQRERSSRRTPAAVCPERNVSSKVRSSFSKAPPRTKPVGSADSAGAIGFENHNKRKDAAVGQWSTGRQYRWLDALGFRPESTLNGRTWQSRRSDYCRRFESLGGLRRADPLLLVVRTGASDRDGKALFPRRNPSGPGRERAWKLWRVLKDERLEVWRCTQRDFFLTASIGDGGSKRSQPCAGRLFGAAGPRRVMYHAAVAGRVAGGDSPRSPEGRARASKSCESG